MSSLGPGVQVHYHPGVVGEKFNVCSKPHLDGFRPKVFGFKPKCPWFGHRSDVVLMIEVKMPLVYGRSMMA